MRQQLTFNELEKIGRKCRRQRTDAVFNAGQLSINEFEQTELKCRQMRSAAIANMSASLLKSIGAGLSSAASAVKFGGHRNKAIGASVR